MNEYDLQAKEFLKRNNAKMTISHVMEKGHVYGRSTSEWKRATITGGWLYRVRIDRNGKTWSFQFSDSVYNRIHNKRPRPYDVLACIEKYEPYGDVWDFAREYGYEINSKESYKEIEQIFKAVKKEYNNVIRIFGDCIDELCKIQ